MKIEIWSDYVCPFCYIGERKLEKALIESGMENNVEIEFKSFELDPNAAREYDDSIDEILVKKYGMSLDQVKASNRNIIQAAKDLGLEYDFDNLQPTNSFDAHRLSHYAKSEGLLKEYTEAVMKSYFTDSLLISDHNVLASLAEQIGLDRNKALEILNSQDFSQEVRDDENAAYARGINGVPYFVFDSKKVISGAQAVSTFIEVLEDLKKK